MRKTILGIVIVLLVATPCFAQEIEPDGLFSVEGTLWNVCYITITFSLSIGQPFSMYCNRMGFYEGAYWCVEDECRLGGFLYIDSPVLSIAYVLPFRGYFTLLVMQPIGIGIGIGYKDLSPHPSFEYSIFLMYKIDNNWTPHDQPIRCYNSDQCPDDMVCVDDPSYECDPNLGDSCPGFCVNE